MARFAASQGSLTEAINTLADQTTATTRAATVNAAASPLQMTAAMALGGIFITSTSGAFQLNLPVPAAFVAGVPNCQVGTTVVLVVRNDGDNTLTIATNSVTGITLSGTATLATTLGQVLVFKFTNVTAAAEAYTCYVGLKVAN